LAKANPASDENTTTDAVATPATSTELSSAWVNITSWLSKTRRMLVASSLPGVSGGGIELMSLLGREAMTTM
jgi:hypothetical protein